MTLKKQPAYNLKVVTQETGIKPDTLRAWERRYGLPNPARTEGGHRIYSPRDIDIIKWLMERQREGLTISRAVELWHSMEEEGRDPLQDMGLPPSITPSYHPTIPEGQIIDDYRNAWVQACLDFNSTLAEQTLNQAFALFPVESVCFDILGKGLNEIGSHWYKGDISVQQEHFASAMAIKQLNAILTSTPSPTRSGRILIGCPPGEEHTFPPLLVTLLLRRRGWDVIYLGANVPKERFVSTIQEINPLLIILVAQTLQTSASLLEIVEAIQASQTMIAYGGSIFTRNKNIRKKIPAHFLGEDLKESIHTIEKLLSVRPNTPKVEHIPEIYEKAHRNYQQILGVIDFNLMERTQDLDLSNEYLSIAQEHLSKDILAALKLGDMTLLDSEIQWIKNLITNYNQSERTLQIFLIAYHEILREELDTKGGPILEWFENANLIQP